MGGSERVPAQAIGPYRIEALLGRGGMGVVYRAIDTRTGTAVALKVLAADAASDARFVARFDRERDAARAVEHPNVVPLLDAGEAAGRPYLAFELVPGGSLAARLAKSGALPWREVATLGAGIARGLAAIHDAGLVHRDLKPANVLLDGDGRPRVADLGLARWIDGARARALTRTGELVGTVEYLAPEQADAAREVGPPADLYALGATLYALATGSPPFEGAGFEIVKKHLVDVPRPLGARVPGIPRELDDLVLGLLAKRPEDRGGSAAEVAARLEAIARGSGTSRRSAGRSLLAVGALVVAGGTGGLLLFPRHPSDPAPAVAASPTPSAHLSPSPSPRPPGSAPEWFDRLEPRPSIPLPRGLRFGHAPGEYENAVDGSVLVYVAGGHFHPARTPDREVDVHPFFLGKLEVSHAQFARFVEATGYETEPEKVGGFHRRRRSGESQTGDPEDSLSGASWRKPRGTDGPAPRADEPVLQVSWHDAVAYCRWAHLDLPEANEWEFAASAGATRAFPWGNEVPGSDAVVRANLADDSFHRAIDPDGPFVRGYDDHFPAVAPCGSFRMDRALCGALDMAGNACEWCKDADPTSGEAAAGRVWCGGSWCSYPGDARAGARNWNATSDGMGGSLSEDDLGFRVIRRVRD